MSSLTWFPELGIGRYPVTADPYDQSYWERCRERDMTLIGAALTSDRMSWVARYWDGAVCDIGIGGGRFVIEGGHVGFDINTDAVEWLKARNLYFNPYEIPVDAMTFWDSLEHISCPRPLLANCRKWAFVSIPIFTDEEHVKRSKHFRPTEHYWYFTVQGLVDFMEAFGFDLAGMCSMEEPRGREDIKTFAFRRGQECK